MQLNAINSVNNNSPRFQGSRTEQASYQERMDTFDAVVEKANQDVSPITVALTSVLSIAAIAKGKDKIVPLLRKTAVQAGEMFSTGIVKFFDGLAKKIKGQDSTKIFENAANAIKNAADKLRGEGTNSKMLESVKNVMTNILGESKAEKITNFLQNNGITNWVKAFDAAIAAAFVVPLADKFSDKVENICDETKINQAAQVLGVLAEN